MKTINRSLSNRIVVEYLYYIDVINRVVRVVVVKRLRYFEKNFSSSRGITFELIIVKVFAIITIIVAVFFVIFKTFEMKMICFVIIETFNISSTQN